MHPFAHTSVARLHARIAARESDYASVRAQTRQTCMHASVAHGVTPEWSVNRSSVGTGDRLGDVDELIGQECANDSFAK